MSQSPGAFVDTVKATHPQFAEKLNLLQEYAQRKLWHEMTVECTALLQDNDFNAEFGVAFHDSVLRFGREHLNPFAYARMVLLITSRVRSPQQIVEFLGANAITPEYEANQVLRCEEATLRVLELNDGAMCTALTTELTEYLSKRDTLSVHNLLHMQYNRMSAAREWAVSDFDSYYHSVFQYLAYCDEKTTLAAVGVDTLATRLAIAALASSKVHNFGEFVANTVVTTALRGDKAWLLDLLHAFNDGDIAKFEATTKSHLANIQAIPALASQEATLRGKVTLMALLHLIFYTPVTQRTFTFAQIAKRCAVKVDDVEILLLKAFALGLVRGGIDEIEGTTSISYVAPRVLHKKEITTFTENLTKWAEEVSSTERGMHKQLQKLIETTVE
jgi:26S proteasome regulatory subunit N9